MPVHPDDYDDVVARINRKYEGDLKRGDEYEHPPRVSTGSLELDVALGGGLPLGRWTRFWGGYHSTKTLTALSCIREAQALGKSCAYYNIEKQYDPIFAQKRIGIDTKKLTVVEGTTIESIGEKAEALLGVVHMHVFDSCSIAVSEDELNADIRDWRPGIGARAWGKVFRRWEERFDHQENTILLLDQVRVNFKTQGEISAGGKVFDHMTSASVQFRKGNWLYRNEKGFLDEKAKTEYGADGRAQPSGYDVQARVEKSRVGRPLMTATMRLDLDSKQFDRVFELAKMAKYYGVITETSQGRFEYKGVKLHGMPALREFIRGDVTVQEEIKTTALAAVAP